ncbi:MAG: transglycosylase domain-containing protein [Candidatus Paceibacterota bacterium]|jgi:membrane carboxypeptidase/penicillin-binding protein PbpC
MRAASLCKKCAHVFRDKKFLGVFFSALSVFFIASFAMNSALETAYRRQFSVEMRDRNGEAIVRRANEKGHYAEEPKKESPRRLKDFLVRKEDRFFYVHPGINPLSMARAAFRSLTRGNPGGSSTITQQLAKLLLGNEKERTLANKTLEIFYALSLELHLSKEEILNRYIASAFLGNQAQGFETASELYFQKPLDALSDGEMLSLIAALSNPSNQNPWQEKNKAATSALEKKFGAEETRTPAAAKKTYRFQSPLFFELQSMGVECKETCQTTLDLDLSEKLRAILKRNIDASRERGVRNGAIVVIQVPENELLAIIGSPDPSKIADGSRINMALEPRPIGSTIKPFIYLEGFESGLRPYTKVEDREYKYPTASGFPIYPKNYDGKYHGTVTLHEALSNSLNVPSVKVLEYVGLDDFYDFLDRKLSFIPIQNYDSYQYGIALGGLEMDTLTLAHYFTLFPKQGILSPLVILKNGGSIAKQIPPQSKVEKTAKIATAGYIELVNKILSDRKTGVEQFGIKSNLNLTQNNYALKTGTSRDFHDSWVVGYTPDFVVGVWIGNSENTALQQVSGQTGAGEIWREAMELLFTTEYNKKTNFNFKNIADFPTGNSIEFGLPGDIFANRENLLEGKNLILAPHDGDTFDFQTNNIIPLTARKEVEWRIDGVKTGKGTEAKFYPKKAGDYTIEAMAEGGRRESVTVTITNG